MPAKIRGLYQRAGAGEWLYDFKVRGHRFCGSTGHTKRRDAEAWVKEFRERKAREVAELGGDTPMSFAAASTRWWHERGQHRKDAADIERVLAWLQGNIGMRTALRAIDNNTVSRLVATRRAEKVSAATVNRSVTEPLRAILRHAEFLGQAVARIDWRALLLKESAGRVREMTAEEEARIFAAIREDFRPVARFLLVMGLRRAEACNLRWRDVDLDTGFVTIHAKGGRVDRRPVPAAGMAVLRGEVGRHHERVFTYAVRHSEFAGAAKGARVPIDPDTLSTAFWRARKAAGLADANIRLHDLRHTAASRIVRKTGNLQAAGKALGHARITTTERYAHLHAEDVRAALDAAAPVAAEVPAAKKAQK